ncbi:MAG: SurA N-terminal domain-containing protein, partial [Flavobacteriaceae bacterium]|nr:SurA N-terminal domain-containing protein [Flavobacteriaceae bacterium]
MAILSKIRDRSLALIAVIGLALFAFVLDPSTLGDFFDSAKVNEVGEVDGEAISRKEFAEAVESYKARSRNTATEMQAGNIVWNNILREKIYTQQLEKAGITIGETDVFNKVISLPSVASIPQFLNEAGLFDPNKFKQFLKDAQVSEDQSLWNGWKGYMDQIGADLKRDTYTNLVNAGIGASLREGESKYNEDNSLLSADFVYIPYLSIADSLVTVTQKDIEGYMNRNSKEFQVDASRDISFVKFEVKATTKDKEDIKSEVATLLEDRKEFNKVTKGERTVLGLKNVTDYKEFFNENKSDIPFAESFVMKNKLPKVISESILSAKENDTFGPYEEAGFFKVSKILEIVQRPDSVKSSHILIPFTGSLAANGLVVKTEEQAKFSADSIYSLVRNNKKKFAKIATEINKDGSKDKGGDIGWVPYQFAFSSRFDVDFAEFIFDNKQGKVGVVKSKFGFHIIRIDEQKNKQSSFKIVTFGREIVASQDTEDTVFQEAETFALSIMDGNTNKFYTVAKEKNYGTKPAIGLKVLDDRVPGLPGLQRDIVSWSFSKDTKKGDFRRFDIDNGYVVATLVNKTEEGISPASKVSSKVRPILIKEKKAKLIEEKMKGATLNDIATGNKVSVRKMSDVALKSPSIVGVGFEPKVVGAMFYAKENQLYTKVVGDRGVFAFVLTKKELATSLPNYESYR